MLCLHVRPKACRHTSLKYSVTSSISCRFKSVTMMKISSQPESCMPRSSMSSGSCARPSDEHKEQNTRKIAHHRKNHRHHRQLPLLHRSVVIYMCRPSSIEGNEAPRIDRATKDVLWHEFAFAPNDNLLALSMGMFAISDIPKPLVIGVVSVIAMFEPFVYQRVCRVVIEGSFDQLSHREARRSE